LYKFLAPNRTQLYSAQETCMHVIKTARFSWSAVFLATSDSAIVLIVIHACYDVVLYKKHAFKLEQMNLHQIF